MVLGVNYRFPVTIWRATAGVAAVSCGRNFVGIELDEDYFKAAKERIERETRQIAMF